jgi:hypothetical protein
MNEEPQWVVVEVNPKRDRVFAFRHSGSGKPNKPQGGPRFILSKGQTLDLIRRLNDCAVSHGWIESLECRNG